jgi:hypothetical protein
MAILPAIGLDSPGNDAMAYLTHKSPSFPCRKSSETARKLIGNRRAIRIPKRIEPHSSDGQTPYIFEV